MSYVLDDVMEQPELVSVFPRSKTPVLLGLDIGTSGVRAGLFDERGEEIRSVRIDRSFLNASAEIGVFEADSQVEQVEQAIDTLLDESTEPIELISISCFWHSLVGVDDHNKPTTAVLGWADSRAVAATNELRSELNEAAIHARTGCRLHPSYWPAKLRRLKTEEPSLFSATKFWLSFSDYLTLKLFGETATSVSMASGTGLLNQHTCEWDAEMIEASGISFDSLPEIPASGRTFRGLAPPYAMRWPLLREARLFPAIGDGAANNIGAGCTSNRKTALMIGTSGAMRVCSTFDPPAKLPSELWCYRVDRNRILLGGALSDGGSLYRWIRNHLLPDQLAEAIESEVKSLHPDAHGLTILPFWNGERSPGWNPEAQGSITGLRAGTRPIEILRAGMEAVAYRFALIKRALEPFAPGAELIASGHAMESSPVWAQILADVLGEAVSVSKLSEASLRGAALLVLEAAGKIQSIEEFSAPVEVVYEPNESHHEVYRRAIDRQESLYHKIYPQVNFKSGQVK